jgi:phosphatidylserine synthase
MDLNNSKTRGFIGFSPTVWDFIGFKEFLFVVCTYPCWRIIVCWMSCVVQIGFDQVLRLEFTKLKWLPSLRDANVLNEYIYIYVMYIYVYIYIFILLLLSVIIILLNCCIIRLQIKRWTHIWTLICWHDHDVLIRNSWCTNADGTVWIHLNWGQKSLHLNGWR